MTLRTGGVRFSGHLERFDKTQLVLAERPAAPLPLADIKAVKEMRPRKQPAVWNPARGFARSWKMAAIAVGLILVMGVYAAKNTR